MSFRRLLSPAPCLASHMLKLESLEDTDGDHKAKWLGSPVQLSKEDRQFTFSQW